MSLTKQHWYGVIVGAIVLALGISGFNIYKARTAEKEQAMIFQLRQLRTAVELFQKTHKSLPTDLKAATIVSIDGKAVPIQWSFEKDKEGKPVDPFGVAYMYDGKSGWVKSGSAGYEAW